MKIKVTGGIDRLALSAPLKRAAPKLEIKPSAPVAQAPTIDADSVVDDADSGFSAGYLYSSKLKHPPIAAKTVPKVR